MDTPHPDPSMTLHPAFPSLGLDPGRRPVPSPVTPVNAVRVTVWTAVLALGVYASMVAVASMSGTTPGTRLAAVLIGFALVPFAASPIEWFVHRFVYHEPKIAPLTAIYTVHTSHHFSYFPTWRYVTGGPARRLPVTRKTTIAATSGVKNGSIRLAHFVWYMAFGLLFLWGPGWLITGDPWFVAGLLAGSAVVSNLFIVVHDTIHRPGSHRIVEAQPWFRFLDNHHWIHHVDLGVNLNFLLPLADLLYGTLRTCLTEAELSAHGSLADAKVLTVGRGERARSA